MRKALYLFMTLNIIFILTACGQGNNDENGQSTPINDSENNQSLNDENVDGNSNDANSGNNDENSNAEQDDNEANSNEDNENNDADEVETIDNLSLFFSDDQLMEIYRVNTDITVTADESGAKEAYSIWLVGPEASNLVSLLPETTAVESVEFKNDVAYVSFNKAILDANLGSTGEAMIIDQITAIASQFGYMETQILIESEIPESFLGHMTVSEPIAAPDINQFKVAQ